MKKNFVTLVLVAFVAGAVTGLVVYKEVYRHFTQLPSDLSGGPKFQLQHLLSDGSQLLVIEDEENGKTTPRLAQLYKNEEGKLRLLVYASAEGSFAIDRNPNTRLVAFFLGVDTPSGPQWYVDHIADPRAYEELGGK